MLYVGLHQDGEALETGTKKFEDLEFQQLERESSLEEERETISQQLLQERAEYHSSVARRKVRKHPTNCGPSLIPEYPYDGLYSMGFWSSQWQIVLQTFSIYLVWPCSYQKPLEVKSSFHTRQRDSSQTSLNHLETVCLFIFLLTTEVSSGHEFSISF